MKISELKGIKISDLKQMSQSQLESYVRQAAKIVNTKVNKLYRAGAGITGAEKIAPDAYQYIENTGGLISIYNDYKYSNKIVKKSREELISEIQRAKKFINMKTSSVKVAKKTQAFRKKVAKLNDKKDNINKKISQYRENFKKLKEEFPHVPSEEVAYHLMEAGGDIEKAREKTKSWMSDIRRKMDETAKKATAKTGFTSQWFNNDEERLPFV